MAEEGCNSLVFHKESSTCIGIKPAIACATFYTLLGARFYRLSTLQTTTTKATTTTTTTPSTTTTIPPTTTTTTSTATITTTTSTATTTTKPTSIRTTPTSTTTKLTTTTALTTTTSTTPTTTPTTTTTIQSTTSSTTTTTTTPTTTTTALTTATTTPTTATTIPPTTTTTTSTTPSTTATTTKTTKPTTTSMTTSPSLGCSTSISLLDGVDDSQFSASSSRNSEHGPSKARLDANTSWASGNSNAHEFISVDFGDLRNVTCVVLQGSCCVDEWVKTYYLRTSEDCGSFTWVTDENSYAVVFAGSTDTHTCSEHLKSSNKCSVRPCHGSDLA